LSSILFLFTNTNVILTIVAQTPSYNNILVNSMSTTERWKDSNAKKLLVDDILMGIVTETMAASDVYTMHEQYKEFPYKNFKVNLRNLTASIKKARDCASFDKVAFSHDMELFSKSGKFKNQKFWPGSKAQTLLIEDVKNGIHSTMKPMQLWLTNESYQEFSSDVFRKHIHQEVQKRKQSSYWQHKKEEKAKQKQKKTSKVPLDDEH
jgi:hypothetical protein